MTRAEAIEKALESFVEWYGGRGGGASDDDELWPVEEQTDERVIAAMRALALPREESAEGYVMLAGWNALRSGVWTQGAVFSSAGAKSDLRVRVTVLPTAAPEGEEGTTP